MSTSFPAHNAVVKERTWHTLWPALWCTWCDRDVRMWCTWCVCVYVCDTWHDPRYV